MIFTNLILYSINTEYIKCREGKIHMNKLKIIQYN